MVGSKELGLLLSPRLKGEPKWDKTERANDVVDDLDVGEGVAVAVLRHGHQLLRGEASAKGTTGDEGTRRGSKSRGEERRGERRGNTNAGDRGSEDDPSERQKVPRQVRDGQHGHDAEQQRLAEGLCGLPL